MRTEAEKEKAEENYGGLAFTLWDFALTLFLAALKEPNATARWGGLRQTASSWSGMLSRCGFAVSTAFCHCSCTAVAHLAESTLAWQY